MTQARAFDLLHPKVQRFISRAHWERFRPIQDDAIQILTRDKGHLLICAPTASGKTEAAFLPIVSQIADDSSGSFRALYISPLKALINDQFRRIDRMCEDLGVPVTKWHGDVDQGRKQKAVKNPGGVLLITPESLEAILLHKPQHIRRLFGSLRWVVIDEIHSFVGAERGAQLRSLLARIEMEAETRAFRIGLSATIGNPEKVARWMADTEEVAIVQDEDWDESGLEGIVRGFEIKNPFLKTESEGDPEVSAPRMLESIRDHFSEGKNLIFGNSKGKLEEVCYRVKKLADVHGDKTSFLIHHGSLSKAVRESAESEVKESNRATSVFCTSTLEMGVDIGAIEKIGLLDPPWSVSSFAQRVGRSGRRAGTNKKFEFLIQQEELHEGSHLSELLREDLVKSIACVLLYLKDFKEDLRVDGSHDSTMAHQILSFCVQKSGADLSQIEDLVRRGFRWAGKPDELGEFLSHLVSTGFLYRDDGGLYSGGPLGEKLVEHYEFYSVFTSQEQWTVLHESHEVGMIPVISPYRENDRILLGGRVWTVVHVNESAKRLSVKPSRSGRAPLFGAAAGITDRRIHQMMREVYESQSTYAFLDAKALELLEQGRESFRRLVISDPAARVVPIFEGSMVQNTVRIGLKKLGYDFGLTETCLEFQSDPGLWRSRLADLFAGLQNEIDLVADLPHQFKISEKYDRFISPERLDKSYAVSFIDLAGAKKWLAR